MIFGGQSLYDLSLSDLTVTYLPPELQLTMQLLRFGLSEAKFAIVEGVRPEVVQ